MARPVRRLFHRIWQGVDDATWRTGTWLRLRDDPHAALVPAAFRRDGMYRMGRNGRMFLAHDSSRLIDQHSGRLTISEEQLLAWSRLIAGRVAALEPHGCAYVVLIPPNAHSVYPEDLPRDVRTAPVRPVHSLMSHLFEQVPEVPIVYPLPELRARKQTAEVFPRTESHWNELGAFVAYRALLHAIPESVPMRRLEEDQIWFFELNGPGDLGIKRRLPRKSPHLFGYMRHPDAHLVADNMVEGTGNVMVTECPVAPPATCVVFGDSYTYGLLPFLSESFGRLVFAQTPGFDKELIDRESPALVLTVISERFLRDVPDDDLDLSVEERAVAKKATGAIRVRMDRWDHERHFSPAVVEWIRARMLAEGRESDAMIVAVLAYAGLRPAELQQLRWRHITPTALLVRTRPSGPGEAQQRPWPIRSVPLLEPLKRDLLQWRSSVEPRHDKEFVFSSPLTGEAWVHGEWRRWAEERYLPLVEELGLELTGPGDLKATYVALRIHAGASTAELAAEVDQDPEYMAIAQGHRVSYAARAGYAPAEAEIERARRLIMATAPPLRETVPRT